MPDLRGLATGIGSLPFKDAQEAVKLVLKYFPRVPFWPQLPRVDMREGMIAQFSQNLPCLKMTPDGLEFNSKNKDGELEVFYEQIITHNLEHFRIGPDYAAGLHEFHEALGKTNLRGVDFIKCHITGPFTFAAGIKDENGASLMGDPIFMQVIVKALIMKALWQVKHFSKFGKQIILFIDEPYLGAYGSAYSPVNREDVVKVLKEMAEGISSEDVIAGVHCCGNTDWSMFTSIDSIKLINFDAFGFMDKFLLYAGDLKAFLARGGIICWGIVPTQEFTGKETAELLLKKILGGIDSLVKKGLDRSLLLEHLFISPACGLGSLQTEKPEKIFSLLSALAQEIRKI